MLVSMLELAQQCRDSLVRGRKLVRQLIITLIVSAKEALTLICSSNFHFNPTCKTQVLMITILRQSQVRLLLAFSNNKMVATRSTWVTTSGRSRICLKTSIWIKNIQLMQSAQMGRVCRETITLQVLDTPQHAKCSASNGTDLGLNSKTSSRSTTKTIILQSHAPFPDRQTRTLKLRCTGISRLGTTCKWRNKKIWI